MKRKRIEQLVAEFIAGNPSRDERFRLAATMLHQSVIVLEPVDDATTDTAQDALQAVLDMAGLFGIDIWND